MGDLTFVVKDAGTGQPIENAEVVADVSNQPCGFLAIGCSSGSPYTLDAYTNASGTVNFSLKYNTATSVQYQVMANGYNTQSGALSITGSNMVDENVWYSKNINLTKAVINQLPPPNQGSLANVWNLPFQTALQDVGYSASNAGFVGSIELTIVVVVVAIAVIIGLIAMVVLS